MTTIDLVQIHPFPDEYTEVSQEGLNSSSSNPEVAVVFLVRASSSRAPAWQKNNYIDSIKHVKCHLPISRKVWKRVNPKELGFPHMQVRD